MGPAKFFLDGYAREGLKLDCRLIMAMTEGSGFDIGTAFERHLKNRAYHAGSWFIFQPNAILYVQSIIDAHLGSSTVCLKP